MKIERMEVNNYLDMFGADIEKKVESMLDHVEYGDLGKISGGFFMKNEKIFFFYYYKENIYQYINVDKCSYDVIMLFDDIIQDVIEEEHTSEFSAKENIADNIYTEIYQMIQRYVELREYKYDFIKELKNYQGKTLYKSKIDDLVKNNYSEHFGFEYENEFESEYDSLYENEPEDGDECNVIEYNLANKFEECLNNIYLSIKIRVIEEDTEDDGFLCMIYELDIIHHKDISNSIEELKCK
ncbi:hypothetical protein [Clostridioides sp. ES-S-0048-02]|uniref:hypothetical protein n=1 Tax=Clostridioides sp. ES-S-0048-02 TaxID=2770777 RepID=UPI001D10D673|nr:hypothetical protein [Clostridioides sp. ES-S-0048-02]